MLFNQNLLNSVLSATKQAYPVLPYYANIAKRRAVTFAGKAAYKAKAKAKAAIVPTTKVPDLGILEKFGPEHGMVKMSPKAFGMLTGGRQNIGGFSIPLTKKGSVQANKTILGTDSDEWIGSGLRKARTKVTHESNLFSDRGTFKEIVTNLQEAKRAGYKAIAVFPKSFDPKTTSSKGLIYHERIHQSRMQSGVFGSKSLTDNSPMFKRLLTTMGYKPISQNIYEEGLAYKASMGFELADVKSPLARTLNYRRLFLRELKNIPTPTVEEVIKDLSTTRLNSNLAGNTIEGMAHGGAAEKLRKTLTDFGSAWRGIIRSSKAGWDSLNLFETVGVSVPTNFLQRIRLRVGSHLGNTLGDPSSIIRDMKIARKAGHKKLVILPPLKDPNRRFCKNTRGIIKHERTHQFDKSSFASKPHKNIPKGVVQEFKNMGYLEANIQRELTANLAQLDYLYKTTGKRNSLYRSQPGMIDEWRLQHALARVPSASARFNPEINNYLKHRIMSGYTPPHRMPDDLMRIARIKSNVNSNTIEGMNHNGWAEKLRHIFTDFGSAWRGMARLGQEAMHTLWPMGLWEGLTVPITKQGTAAMLKTLKPGKAGQDIISALPGQRKFFDVGTPGRKQYRELIHDIRMARKRGYHSVVLANPTFASKEVAVAFDMAGFNVKEYLTSLQKHEMVHQLRIQTGQVGKTALPKGKYPAFEKFLASNPMYQDLSSIGKYEELLAFAAVFRNKTSTKMALEMGGINEPVLKELASVHVPSMKSVKARIVRNLQQSTNMVKSNTSGFTTPGIAMSPGRGGSRQGPMGGT